MGTVAMRGEIRLARLPGPLARLPGPLDSLPGPLARCNTRGQTSDAAVPARPVPALRGARTRSSLPGSLQDIFYHISWSGPSIILFQNEFKDCQHIADQTLKVESAV